MMKTSSTLLIVGLVILILYLWMQSNKPKATVPAGARVATAPQPSTSSLINSLAKLLGGNQSKSTGGGGGGFSGGGGSAGSSGAGSGLRAAAGQDPSGVRTDPSTGLVYDAFGNVIGQNGVAGAQLGVTTDGIPFFQGSDGNLVDPSGNPVTSDQIGSTTGVVGPTLESTTAGVTGPTLDSTGTVDTSQFDVQAMQDASLADTTSSFDTTSFDSGGGGGY